MVQNMFDIEAKVMYNIDNTALVAMCQVKTIFDPPYRDVIYERPSKQTKVCLMLRHRK